MTHCYAFQVYGPGQRLLGILFADTGWHATVEAIRVFECRDLFVAPRLTHAKETNE